jgi:hypothetical protein
MHGDNPLRSLVEWVSPVEGHGSRDRRLSARPTGFSSVDLQKSDAPPPLPPTTTTSSTTTTSVLQLLAEPGQRNLPPRDRMAQLGPPSDEHRRDHDCGRLHGTC